MKKIVFILSAFIFATQLSFAQEYPNNSDKRLLNGRIKTSAPPPGGKGMTILIGLVGLTTV